MTTTSIEVPARGILDPAAITRVLALHAIPGVDVVDTPARTLTRLLRLPSGFAPVTLGFSSDGVRADVRALAPNDQSALEAVLRWWFDLDTDLAPVHAALSADPVLRPLLAARPGLRIVRIPEPFEAAATTVLGQQVSLAACRTFSGRLAASYGDPIGESDGLSRFPTAARIAAADTEELRSAVGLTRSRAGTLQAVAHAFAAASRANGGTRRGGAGTGPGDAGIGSGNAGTGAGSGGADQDLEGAGPAAVFPLDREQLLALPGVGPWTADYLAVRAIGDPDAFTPGDLVLRRALATADGAPVDTRAAAERSEAWRPFRAYALAHLWASTTV